MQLLGIRSAVTYKVFNIDEGKSIVPGSPLSLSGAAAAEEP